VRRVSVPLQIRALPVDLPAVGLAHIGGLGGGRSVVTSEAVESFVCMGFE